MSDYNEIITKLENDFPSNYTERPELIKFKDLDTTLYIMSEIVEIKTKFGPGRIATMKHTKDQSVCRSFLPGSIIKRLQTDYPESNKETVFYLLNKGLKKSLKQNYTYYDVRILEKTE